MAGRYVIEIDSPRSRREEWAEVFGTTEIPVQRPELEYADLPGRPAELVYMLDLAWLTPERRSRLVAHLARKFRIDPDLVERDLNSVGVPLVAAGCRLPVDGKPARPRRPEVLPNGIDARLLR